MAIIKEKLTDLKEQYEKAIKLVEEDSKLDPETEPYKSHYAAGEVLVQLQNNLKVLMSNLSDGPTETYDEDAFVYKSILGFVCKDIGRVHVFTNDLAAAENYLNVCVDLLAEYRLKPETIIPYIEALNQLGILWSNRQDIVKSKEYLQKAESVYNDFIPLKLIPLTVFDIFGTKDEITGKGMDIFEKTHTLTMFYMAQILGSEGDLHGSASYCHETLRRQLDHKDYEPVDWALNAATLSQYYLTQNAFVVSRHHLASATYMMAKYEEAMYTPEMSEDQKAAALEVYRHRYADVCRCWAKYALYVMEESRSRLMNDEDDENADESSKKELIEATLAKKMMALKLNGSKALRFNLPISMYEDCMATEYCLTFDDAKLMFDALKKYLDDAKEYYTADTEASEYAKIIQDYSTMYKLLAFFEESNSNRSKLQLIRTELLEDLLSQLNPTFYMAICRECWYEVALVYQILLDLKLEHLESLRITQNPDAAAVKDVNNYCEKSIDYLKKFVDSFRNGDDNELPPSMPAEEYMPILYAYFHTARLFYKIITPDKQQQMKNLSNSVEYYKLFVTAFEKREDLANMKLGELGICRDMIALLPLKMQRIQKEIEKERQREED